MFLETTCRDAARFGYMYLRNGNWTAPRSCRRSSSRKPPTLAGPQRRLGVHVVAEPARFAVSVDNMLTPDYEEPSNLQLVPDAPDDMYWALGFGGRFIQVHPATDTVVVRLGDGDEAANMQQVTRMITEGFVGDHDG